MIDFVIERDIARSPGEVFAYVVDATKLASWQTNTVSAVPDGPMGLGTKIREVHRAPGKQIATVVEVVEYEPDRVFGMRIIEGVPVHGRITFEPSDTGTRFSVNGHRFLPTGGHLIPHWWPSFLPAGGHRISPSVAVVSPQRGWAWVRSAA